MERRSCWPPPSPWPAPDSTVVDPATETGHGHLDDTIVSPLQERKAEATGQPHGRLTHLDRPGHLGPGPVALRVQPQSGLPDQVPTHHGVDRMRTPTLDQLDTQPHAIGKRRRHPAVEHRPRRQAIPLDPEVGQPRPPALEVIELFDQVPQLFRCRFEQELTPIDEHAGGHDPRVGPGPFNRAGTCQSTVVPSPTARWSPSRANRSSASPTSVPGGDRSAIRAPAANSASPPWEGWRM